MDPYGNIYDAEKLSEEMTRELEHEDEVDELNKLIDADKARYIASLNQAEAEARMRERLRAPFKKGQ